MAAMQIQEVDYRQISVTSNSVAVLGFHDSSAGQTDTWIEEATGLHLACFILESIEPFEVDIEGENKQRVSQRTAFPIKDTFLDRPFIVASDWPERLQKLGIGKVLPLTPNNRERLRQIETCREYGFELISAIHPTATILAGASIEPGVLINARSIIGYKAEIETGVLIDTGVQVDHHNVLKSCCQLDPGVVTAGNVTLWECSHLHTAVTVINRIHIGEDAIIGAGATVISDIPPRCTAVGVPAKVIKYHQNIY